MYDAEPNFQLKRIFPSPLKVNIHNIHCYIDLNANWKISNYDNDPVGWDCWIHRLYLCRGVRLPQQVSSVRVGWGCRIHRLHHFRGVRLPNECSVYDTKHSDGEAPVMLDLSGMRSNSSLPSLPGPIYGSNRTKLCTYSKLNCLK